MADDPATQTPLLEITELCTDFRTRAGQVRVIEHVDIAVGHGEVVALVGESGSGKSITALSVMRLLPTDAEITGGSIRLNGLDLLSLPESEMNAVRGHRIGMLFQQPKASLDPTNKVGYQVGESLRLKGKTSKRAAWLQSVGMLADVGISEPARRAHAYAHELSGGMAQRAMIAAALSGDPELLIADEPTTALDVTVQSQILKLLMAKRAERGLSIFLITHDLGIVAAIANRVMVMYAGRIVEQGRTEQIFGDPQHPYTKALLESSLMRPDENGRLVSLPGAMPRANDLPGCRFRSRCSLAERLGITDQCDAHEPPLSPHADEHSVRCWAVPTAS